MFKMVERLSVGAFVKNRQEKYLLVSKIGKANEKYWDVPKGGVEKGESLVEALKRELQEELGTDKFRNIRKLNINFSFNYPIEIKKLTGFDSQKVELFFVEFYGEDKDIKVDKKEIDNFVFVDEKEFLQKVSYETTKEAFRKFLKLKSF
jgi:putative (di)nucleoside polyphosphate hydrolase